MGLGNPLLGDDGVGWRVADEVERRLSHGEAATDAVVERLCVGGLALMERLVGCAHAIVVDAFVSGSAPAGTVRSASLDDLDTSHASHLDSAHDASLLVALEAGRALGAALPARVDVVAV
ncbi:MAG TPA: hydrogenase maturation protease, partial [Candidatus Dormibacteraeota bacterium]|nr:hydrogenase maturation protease [Candidatus Dormibacteraeota bacterium]